MICATEKCQPIVSDGITLGHACCGVFRCTQPLQNNRDRFCAEHRGLHNTCTITGCNHPIRCGDAKTCDNRDHQQMEQLHYAKATSAFALSERPLRY
ncbi:hypothetical protein BDR07DRAFT_1309831 [Suillus spraguei]|nr:hypothetical protein BDR07DRAFT_1309831 [Suillus spraguei]